MKNELTYLLFGWVAVFLSIAWKKHQQNQMYWLYLVSWSMFSPTAWSVTDLGNRHFTTGFSECMHGVLTTLGLYFFSWNIFSPTAWSVTYLGNRHFTTGFSECMHGVLITLGLYFFYWNIFSPTAWSVTYLGTDTLRQTFLNVWMVYWQHLMLFISWPECLDKRCNTCVWIFMFGLSYLAKVISYVCDLTTPFMKFLWVLLPE